jgi:dihydroorotase
LVLGATPQQTERRDIACAAGRFVAPDDLAADTLCLDGTGLVLAPGLIDMHVHLREPGGEHKETIASGARAALAGGFTTVGAMPNTTPVIDDTTLWERNHATASQAAAARVIQYAAATLGQRGERLADLRALDAAGCVAFSDDGRPISSPRVAVTVLRLLAELGRPLLVHAEELSLAGGAIHDGIAARTLGVAGIDPLAEELMTLRDVYLAEATGAHVHICHVSTARAVEIIRRARAHGAPVTAEVCPHHLLLDETQLLASGGDPDFKMNPPLRTAADRAACLAGLCDGTLDAIVSDHAPHSAAEKASGLAAAPFGIVGLETTLPLVLSEIVAPGLLTLEAAIQRLSAVPARILGLPFGSLALGAPADLTLIDTNERWTISRQAMRSRSTNTPFDGRSVSGRAVLTIVGGVLHPQTARGQQLVTGATHHAS